MTPPYFISMQIMVLGISRKEVYIYFAIHMFSTNSIDIYGNIIFLQEYVFEIAKPLVEYIEVGAADEFLVLGCSSLY